MLCQECPHKQFCSSLCPEAELFASQDWTNLQELTIGEPAFGKPWPTILRSDPAKERFRKTYAKSSKREKQILSLLAIGLNKKEICKELKITRENLDFLIHTIRKKAQKL